MRLLLVCVTLIGVAACTGSEPGPATDERAGPVSNIFYLKLETSSLGDAGSAPARTTLTVQALGDLEFADGSGPLRDGRMTSAEQQQLAALLSAPGALDEILSAVPCGRPGADHNEWLTVAAPATSANEVRKEITGCAKPPYGSLRTLLLSLRDRHFRWAAGTCPVPNIWRYMSPGCGAEARPVCGSSSGDACAATRCACDGRDIVGCDFTTEPYAHVGPCNRDGGGQ